MLWDVSWDQNNIIDGSRYSDHVFALLKDTLIVRPSSPGQGTKQASSGCAEKPDGQYLNSSDCSKYYLCHGGVMFENNCPPGQLYNAETKLCDWSVNVKC
ncbi:chitotriosidase-1-like [Orbicella faveolata]|uniref:chitotriosidase-1-like n=1 Tax=Orbicella faveolata TaxID=48498 RepID=UPI0009E470D0|nr:chitotriosidase-1-like [Orbicella faveolata]XP_020620185.1 chitotriosidase-1-like [Orbicella faveolata]